MSQQIQISQNFGSYNQILSYTSQFLSLETGAAQPFSVHLIISMVTKSNNITS